MEREDNRIQNLKEDGFWKRVNDNLKKVLQELREDSVSNNPTKPVDCCNPPVSPRTYGGSRQDTGKGKD